MAIRDRIHDAVYKFKRYEDSSLIYTGINKYEGEHIGLFDTVLNAMDYHATFENVSEKV
jgi:uridylate kinase